MVAAGLQRRLELRAPGRVGPGAPGREPRRQRVDGAAHLVELADARRIEPGDLKAAAAAFGDQPLPVQQMQRMGDRLARYAELLGQLVLPDAMPRRQRAVDDRLEDPGIDLVDQVGERIQRDHAGGPIWNTEFRIQNSSTSRPRQVDGGGGVPWSAAVRQPPRYTLMGRT